MNVAASTTGQIEFERVDYEEGLQAAKEVKPFNIGYAGDAFEQYSEDGVINEQQFRKWMADVYADCDADVYWKDKANVTKKDHLDADDFFRFYAMNFS